MTVAPIQEPSVPATTMPVSDMPPRVLARCAAGGITTSLGSGMTELSMAISSTISP